ncbi:MAG: hypothetical protein ACK4HV_00790 [Parachlamydiaceae bacterium]
MPDTRNPKPLFRTDHEQFFALHNRYMKAKARIKEDPRILQIAKNKLIDFTSLHPDYKELLPNELK